MRIKYIFILIVVVLGFYFFEKKVKLTNFNETFTTNVITDTKKISKLSIEYLRSLEFDSQAPKIEETLATNTNYAKHIASYTSDGNKIYGLLTIPNTETPEGGFPAIVFVHGYIPPKQYSTTTKYEAYIDNLSKSGFIVFKIDLRGHGNSEGMPSGSYFSPGYTIDAINAVKSLQKYDKVNANKIGIWGHSMAGNAVLRAMLVTDDIKVGVIWAGAVYSYKDLATYKISDASYVRRQESTQPQITPDYDEEIKSYRQFPEKTDYNNEFWKSVSLTQNLRFLNVPIQIHHAINDSVVNIGYSKDLKAALDQENKTSEFYEYSGGEHNIASPYFETAMQRTIEFYKKNL